MGKFNGVDHQNVGPIEPGQYSFSPIEAHRPEVLSRICIWSWDPGINATWSTMGPTNKMLEHVENPIWDPKVGWLNTNPSCGERKVLWLGKAQDSTWTPFWTPQEALTRSRDEQYKGHFTLLVRRTTYWFYSILWGHLHWVIQTVQECTPPQSRPSIVRNFKGQKSPSIQR